MSRTLALLLAVLLAGPAPAEPPPPEEIVALDILPGWRTGDGTRMAGIRIRLAPGWKTYWRAPGAAGIPPDFDWTGSENLAAAALHWPVPRVFHLNGLRAIGYEGEVVIPLEVTPAAPEAPARIAGSVELGVCEDICIPVRLSFDSLLPPRGERDPAIVAALVDRPMTGAEAGAGGVTCRTEAEPRGLELTAVIPIRPLGGEEVVVVESRDPGLWLSEAETRRDGDRLIVTADVRARHGGAIALDRGALRFTVLAGPVAVDLQGCTGG